MTTTHTTPGKTTDKTRATRTKQAYQKKAEAKLAEHKAELDKARARLKGAAAQGQIEAQKQLDGLEEKLEAARTKLHRLKDAGEGAWEDLSEGLEAAWDDLSGSFKKVLARFR